MQSAQRKVLIVDDDPAILRLLNCWLTGAGFDVTEAADGAEALAIARDDCPHYLITDWEMPNLDGIELCRRIRQESFPHYIYTVLLTARTDNGNMVTALEAGADDLLTKPIGAAELLARLRAGARVVDLENQLVRLARTDPLTGIPNRWVFFEQFERELHRSDRQAHALSCVLVDIDFFKVINDTYGHVVGDVILKAFARTLSQSCRDTDYLCRYGGEEFCLLLTDTCEADAAAWAERMRAVLREIVIPINGQQVCITASFGVAERSASVTGPEELVDQADDALRIAKHTGRDRVVRFSQISEASGTELAATGGHRRLFRGLAARNIMTTPVLCLNQEQALSEAAELFLRVRINSAPVVDGEGRLVGIISEKDLMTNSPRSDGWCTSIKELMKRHVVNYDEDTPALVIYDFLCRVAIRRVVVVRDGRPTGVISRGTLLRWFGNWQLAGVVERSAADAVARECRRQALGARLAHTVSGLAECVARLQTEAEASPDQITHAIVSQATRIQELTSDLLSCSQLHYEFSPEQAPAATLDRS